MASIRSSGIVVSVGPGANTPIIRRSFFGVNGASAATCRAVEFYGGNSLLFEDNEAFVIGCAETTALHVDTGSFANTRRNSLTVIPSNGGTGHGVHLEAGAPSAGAWIDASVIAGNAGSAGVTNEVVSAFFAVAITNSQLSNATAAVAGASGSYTRIEHSTLETAPSASAGATIWIADSRLQAEVSGAGVYKCVGAYDSNFDPLAPNCLPPSP